MPMSTDVMGTAVPVDGGLTSYGTFGSSNSNSAFSAGTSR
jgi:hypothetical protein